MIQNMVTCVISGHGFKPIRSLASYLLAIILFAFIYFFLGERYGTTLSSYESLIVSITTFHGRGFFTNTFQPGDPQAAVAAIEALIGLLIEITVIATFTQRFFARSATNN